MKAEVIKLYQKFPLVKKHYIAELSDSTEILKEYKKKIKRQFSTSTAYRKTPIADSKKLVNEFKKIAVHQKDVIELLLCKVESMIACAKMMYIDVNTSFCNSMLSSYSEACHSIVTERLEAYYWKQCEELAYDTDDLDWGLNEGMIDIYINSVQPYDEEETT